MATKKYLKKGKKRNKQRGGAKIPISYNQIRDMIQKILEQTVFVGTFVTDAVITAAMLELFGEIMSSDQLGQLTGLGVKIIGTSIQFILTSLNLTAGVASRVGARALDITSIIGSALWNTASTIGTMCSSNPTAMTAVATATATAATLKQNEIAAFGATLRNLFENLGIVDALAFMTFDLLLKTNAFTDAEGYEQPRIENSVNNVADEIVEVSSAPSSQASSQNDDDVPALMPTSSQEENDEVIPVRDDEGRQRIADLLAEANLAVKNLMPRINYEELSSDFSDDAGENKDFCEILQQNSDASQASSLGTPETPDYSDDEEGILGKRTVREASLGTRKNNKKQETGYDAGDDEEQDGGKRTRHRKRKHNKNKTRKHKKTHTKKHKKHTKKH
jgi:hypothetical protein